MMMMKMGALMMESTVVEVMVMGIIFAFYEESTGPAPYSRTDYLTVSRQPACEAGGFVSSS